MTVTCAGSRSQKAATSAAGRWVPVGLLGLQTRTSWVAAVTSAAIASRSWTSSLGERHADLARPGQRRQVGVHREGRPGVEDLGAGLAERLGGGEQDLAGAVADGDPGRLGVVALGDAAAQQRRVGVRVAVHRRRGGGDRLDHLRVRRRRRLVGGKLGDTASGDRLGRLPGRHTGLVARHAGKLLGKGDGHGRVCPIGGSGARTKRGKDAGRPNSSAIWPTEDAAPRCVQRRY